MVKNRLKRVAMSVTGTAVVAVGVGLLQYAAFGVDPFTSLMMGLDQRVTGISYGLLYIIANGAMLLFALFTQRKYIGLGTVLNLLFIGYIASLTLGGLDALFPSHSLALRTAVFILNFPFLCFGCALCMTADMGVSAYDAIGLVLTHKWKLGPFRYIRVCTDVLCVLAGAGLFFWGGGRWEALTALVGPGTVITALFMGPTIEFFGRPAAKWLEK